MPTQFVELDSASLAEFERIAQESGRSIDEVAQEAIACYLLRERGSNN